METADPKELGFDSGRLRRVAASIDADVAAGRCDGAAICVARHGRIALREARGFADRAAGRRLDVRDVFCTMSVGKQFTNVVVLERIERGELSLHTRVADVIPGFGCRGKERIKLHHLLTHTSGLMSAVPTLPPEDLASIERLAAFAAASAPESIPGERVNYSILVAHAVMAEMVCRVDGARRPFKAILEEDLFTPLGMNDTSLGPRPDLLRRLSPVGACYTDPGLFDPAAIPALGELLLREGAEIPAGGFLTTLADLTRFAEMLRRGGELDGKRILSPAMIDLASRNHTGDRPNELMNYTVGMRGWEPWPAYIGLGFFVRGERLIPGPFGALCHPRSFGGWGAGSTAFWIDPARDVTFSFLSVGLMEDSHHVERVARLSDLALSALAASA